MGDPNQWAVDVIDSLQTDVVELTATRDALAQALANMAECAHDANAAEPMCACPCHAPGSAVAERDRLRAVVDAVRVMFDNVVGTSDDAVMGFPIADYHAIEEALDALDESEATDGARLADALQTVSAERDRLRAVVGALNEEHAALWRVVNALRLHEQTVAANQDGAEQAIADRWQAVEQALDQLDGSEATDG